jgi:hypothetical protein
VSATAVADYGASQALALRPARPTFTAWEVGPCRFLNRSGLPILAGLGVPFLPSAWGAGQVTAAGVYTDDTTDAQDADANDMPLYQHLLPDGNGVLLGATEPFNCLALVQSTAGNQTTPVPVLEFWDGTTWADLSAYVLYTDAYILLTTEKLTVWAIPSLWVPGGSGTNVPQTRYNIRLRHTVAGQGTIDPLAAQIFLGLVRFLSFLQSDADQVWVSGGAIRLPKAGAGLYPLFTVANPKNMVEVGVRWWQ